MSGKIVAWEHGLTVERQRMARLSHSKRHSFGKKGVDYSADGVIDSRGLVLATDYAALVAERDRLHEALRELCKHMISYTGLCRMTGYDKLIPLIQASASRIIALTDQGRAGEAT